MQDDKVWASYASKNLEKFNLTKRKTMIQAEMRNMEKYQRKLRAVKLTSQGSGATWVNQPQEEGDLVSWSRRVAVFFHVSTESHLWAEPSSTRLSCSSVCDPG